MNSWHTGKLTTLPWWLKDDFCVRDCNLSMAMFNFRDCIWSSPLSEHYGAEDYFPFGSTSDSGVRTLYSSGRNGHWTDSLLIAQLHSPQNAWSSSSKKGLRHPNWLWFFWSEVTTLEFSGCPCCFVLEWMIFWYILDLGWCWINVLRHSKPLILQTHFCIAASPTGETYRSGLHQHLGQVHGYWIWCCELPAPLPNRNPYESTSPGLASRFYCRPWCLWKSLWVAPCVVATGCAWRKCGNWHLQLCNQLLDLTHLMMLQCDQVAISRCISVFACRKV